MCKTAYKHKESTLAQLKACGAERVAIAIKRELDYKFSSDEIIFMLGELITYFKGEGFEVFVWIGETIGHDRYSEPVKDYGYTNIVIPEGKSVGAFCPLDEKFTDDVANWLKRVAEFSPDLILLDDDFRMGDSFGCSCGKHLKIMENELGKSVDRGELMGKILGGEANEYRRAYLKAQGDGLTRMAKKIRHAIDEVNPSVRIGACITPDRWDANGIGPVEMAHILAGSTKPLIRLFGAPYHVCITSLSAAIDKERTQFERLKNFDGEVIVEGDTYPRPRYACPAAYLECLDMILRADGGSDGILKYMIDYYAPPKYETGYVDAHIKNMELYKKIDELFDGGECFGFSPYLPLGKMECCELRHTEQEKYRILGEQTFEYDSAYMLLSASALPSCYKEDNVKIVFGESAHLISEKELECGAIIDMVAAKILADRGIDVGIESFNDNDGYKQNGFYDVPFEYYPDTDEYVRMDPTEVCDFTLKPGAKVISKIQRTDKTRDFIYEYENASGAKLLVFPISAENDKAKMGYFKNYHRKGQLINAYERMSGHPLDAYVETDHPEMYMLGKKDDDTLRIGLWNLFSDKADGVRVKINGKISGAEFINCDGHIEGEYAIIDSVIYPYEFAGIKIFKNDLK